jgi:hypothetical protein
LAAARAANWNELRSLMTEEARNTLRNELEMFRKRLQDPEKGAFYEGLARDRAGDRGLEAFRRARDGNHIDALSFYILLAPLPEKPPVKGSQMRKESVDWFYENERGELKLVRLARDPLTGRWAVSEFQL